MKLFFSLCQIVVMIFHLLHVVNSFYLQIDNETFYDLTDFEELVEIDLSAVHELHIFVVGKYMNISSPSNGERVARYKTRVYCYGFNETYNEDEVICSIPGPVWVMTPNDQEQVVVLHNQLYGIGNHEQTAPGVELYKDPDTVNLHTHGLHVSPLVDNIVNIGVDPICSPQLFNYTSLESHNINISSEFDCSDNIDGQGYSHRYNYTIPSAHYPGTHWYHSHWHGSTALHVNGGLYGGIRMLSNPNITNASDYEPDIPDIHDHWAITSFIWLTTTESCNNITNDADYYCGKRGAKHTVEEFGDSYFDVTGSFPFLFNIQSFCWINCKFQNDQPRQYGNSSVQYDSQFYSEWEPYNQRQAYLVNGQFSVCKNCKTLSANTLTIAHVISLFGVE